MNLTPEQKIIGKENYNAAVASVSRRAFMKGAAAAVPSLGAAYFGYNEIKGDPVRVGFIGTGDEGSVLITQHPPAFMNIVAIADLRPYNQKRAFEGDGNEARVGLINKLGADTAKKIKVYKNHKELLADKDIEAVVIAVPLNQHADLAIEAMRAGKHVLSEKLMAHNITQCKEMIKVSKETKKLLAVGHQRHYSVLYQNANDLVKEGLLGDIKFIRANWHRNNSWPAPAKDSWNPVIQKADQEALTDEMVKAFGYDSLEQLCRWRLYNKTGGGLMAELGSHQLDACSIFLGKVKPLAVQGYGGRNFYGVKGVGPEDKQKQIRECDDHVYITMEFPGPHYEEDKNDIVIVTYSSINTNAMEPYGETIFGSRGTMIVEMEQSAMLYREGVPGGAGQSIKVETDKDGKKPAVVAAESPQASAAAQATGPSGKISRGYTEEMEHFCVCIRENNFASPKDGGLHCPGEVAMADAIMALTSNLAMKHRKRIEFKPEWFDPENPAVPETDSQIPTA